MLPSVHQTKVSAMRDNEIVALVFLPSGEVRIFNEPIDLPSACAPDRNDEFCAAVVGLTAQINLTLLMEAA